MEYPHKNYIKYLISRKCERYKIAEECAGLQLLPPNDVDLHLMQREVGLPPSCWVDDFDKAPPEFKKWLNQNGVYELWEEGDDVVAAYGLLNQGKLRHAFESLMLLHGDLEIVREELSNSFTRKIPSMSALETYCYFFWDVASMSKPGIFDFLKAQQNAEFKIAALDGEQDLTYAFLGLKQKPDFVSDLDWFLQYARLETMVLLRAGGGGSGQRSIGHAALMRAAIDAMAMRIELSQDSTASNLRKEAQLFKAKVLPRAPIPIPSIDDLRVDVIDAEPAGETDEEEDSTRGATVHRLPVRR